MVSSKQTRPLGLCRQCESEIFGTYNGDFVNMHSRHQMDDQGPVFCYSCGMINVNKRGECVTKCAARHNWTWLDHVARFFNSGYTPKRLSGELE